MASPSSILKRFSPGRSPDSPILPLHTRRRISPSEANEYDLPDRPTRPEDALLPRKWSEEVPDTTSKSAQWPPSQERQYNLDDLHAPASRKGKQPGVLFREPPPPIAASSIIPSNRSDARRPAPTRGATGKADILSSTRQILKSVVFDSTASLGRRGDATTTFEPDIVWRSLQRREDALQEDIQHMLDAQAAALALQLVPNTAASAFPRSPNITPNTRSVASDAGSDTPTGTETFYSTRSTQAHSTLLQPTKSSVMGEVIPVRQPRKRPLGLRGARAALGRALQQLANLKAEEDASLESALDVRRAALSRLQRLASRRDSVLQELHMLEEDAQEPLGVELRELRAEQQDVNIEIHNLERRLVDLRQRNRQLAEQIHDVGSRREAGLSGYRGALHEADTQIAEIMRRPSVRPLDLEAIRKIPPGGSTVQRGDVQLESSSSVAINFLNLRQDRRTVEMAKDWWDEEIRILEYWRMEVEKERKALEAGENIWRETVESVSKYEQELRRELRNDDEPFTGGADEGVPTKADPKAALRIQLAKMSTIMTGLEQRLSTAEKNGWNLLICAIGAELEAFRQGEHMLEEALQVANNGQASNNREGNSANNAIGSPNYQVSKSAFIDTGADPDGGLDDEVPHDLLVSNEVPTEKLRPEKDQDLTPTGPDRGDSSENEIPQEFLVEHGEAVNGP
jgi:hypothetical protein